MSTLTKTSSRRADRRSLRLLVLAVTTLALFLSVLALAMEAALLPERDDQDRQAARYRRALSQSLARFTLTAQKWAALRGRVRNQAPPAGDELLFLRILGEASTGSESEWIDSALAARFGLGAEPLRDFTRPLAIQMGGGAHDLIVVAPPADPRRPALLGLIIPNPLQDGTAIAAVVPSATLMRPMLADGLRDEREVFVLDQNGSFLMHSGSEFPSRLFESQVLEAVFAPGEPFGRTAYRDGNGQRWRLGFSLLPGTNVAVVVAARVTWLGRLRGNTRGSWTALLCTFIGLMAFGVLSLSRSERAAAGVSAPGVWPVLWTRSLALASVSVVTSGGILFAASKDATRCPDIAGIVRHSHGHTRTGPPGGDVAWSLLPQGSPLVSGVPVRTGRSSALWADLFEGTSIVIGPDSELIVRGVCPFFGAAHVRIELGAGFMELQRKAAGEDSRTPPLAVGVGRSGDVLLNLTSAQIRVQNPERALLTLRDGNASLGGRQLDPGIYRVAKGQAQRADDVEKLDPGPQARLSALEPRREVAFRSASATDEPIDVEISSDDPWLHNPRKIASDETGTVVARLPPGLYFWRVVRSDAAGKNEIRALLVERSFPPARHLPADGARFLASGVGREAAITFSWATRDRGPFRLLIEPSDVGGSSDGVVLSAATATRRLPPGRYKWRVFARAADGEWMGRGPATFEVLAAEEESSEESRAGPSAAATVLCSPFETLRGLQPPPTGGARQERPFVCVDRLAPPTPIVPEEGARVLTSLRGVSFSWEPVAGAIGYDIELLEAGRVMTRKRTESPASDLPVPRSANGPLVWRVRAVGLGGWPGPWAAASLVAEGPHASYRSRHLRAKRVKRKRPRRITRREMVKKEPPKEEPPKEEKVEPAKIEPKVEPKKEPRKVEPPRITKTRVEDD